ncbi:MAG: phosphatase PAP2 family protein [Prevotella sp.]|nr:phosphatase PAP2 family protein [Prevotella sp.]MBR1518960.1 phosphatase PAP2 family protein [Prevotella sp.]
MIDRIVELDYSLMRLLNGSDSIFVDGVMAGITEPLTWSLLYVAMIMLVVRNNQRASRVALIIAAALACVLLSSLVCNGLVKPAVGRLRPYQDPAIASWIDTVWGVGDDSFSFFSAHSANTLSLAVFMALLVRSRVLTLWLVVWSLLNGYSRVYLGMHFPSDVVMGLLCGAVIGVAMYGVYRFAVGKFYSSYSYISSHYTSTGYDHEDVAMVVLVMVATLGYVLIRAIVEYGFTEIRL